MTSSYIVKSLSLLLLIGRFCWMIVSGARANQRWFLVGLNSWHLLGCSTCQAILSESWQTICWTISLSFDHGITRGGLGIFGQHLDPHSNLVTTYIPHLIEGSTPKLRHIIDSLKIVVGYMQYHLRNMLKYRFNIILGINMSSNVLSFFSTWY